LTPEQQKVIFLRFFQGLKSDEIAGILGRNPNAVRALQFRALSQLRRRLEAAHG
jgi:DNA-directed RNA polymerase specialized sigma24 family protein